MKMTGDAADVLQLLIDHELAIKHLYQAFAAAFPDFRDFWQTLAGDEQGHADKLERLRQKQTGHLSGASSPRFEKQAALDSVSRGSYNSTHVELEEGAQMDSAQRHTWRAAIVATTVGVAMVFLFVWLFAAALHQPRAHDLKVGVVGPAGVIERVATAVEANAPGAFALSSYPSAEEARAAIRERELAGALVVGSGQPLIMVASAGGEAASKAISGAFTATAEALGQSPTLEDVQPLPASDPRGLVPFFLVLGVSISGFIFQIIYRAQAGSPHLWSALASMIGFAVLAGLLAALAVAIVLGFDSSYWLLAGVCALLALAVASATAACCGLIGQAGLGVAALVVVLLGNASSGSIIGSAFLPQPFRWLSPVLPAGSGLEAARSALYFDGVGLDWQLGKLAIWVAGSFLLLVCIAGARSLVRRRAGSLA